jgi:hypothetical protein
LGEFSPIGLGAFCFEHFLGNYKSSNPHFWAAPFHTEALALILNKNQDWATFWAIFSQAHLATLFLCNQSEEANTFYSSGSPSSSYLSKASLAAYTMSLLASSKRNPSRYKTELCRPFMVHN